MAIGNKYVEHKMELNDKARVFRKGLWLNELGSTILASGQTMLINQSPTPFIAQDEMDFTQTFSVSMWGKGGCIFFGQRQQDGANRKNTYITTPGIAYSQTFANVITAVNKQTYDLRHIGITTLDHVVVTNVGSPNTSSAATRLANLKVYVNGVDSDSTGLGTTTDSSLNTTTWNTATAFPVFKDARFNYITYVPTSPITGDNFSQGQLADFMFCRNYIITPAEVRQMFNRGTNDVTLYATHYPATVMANRTIHYSFDAGNYTGLVLRNLANPGTFDATISNQTTPNLKDLY